ncbi:16S rRNA (cytosine(1402)-N(4))-methyltransferase RsmH [Oscillatoria amoena NRMC-F 0135]|nr:16S rRNA (cytosine(1402)-N(4))-methyltransferase RsmH [Oscillatoria amoena NRMC-F 0135]
MTAFRHQSVLVDGVLEAMGVRPGGVVVDGTLGGGGHAEAILGARADVTLIGLDQDDEALAAAGERLKGFGKRFLMKKSNYSQANEALKQMGFNAVDGVLLDLGVSSHQLDTPARGFSFQHDGPLDMRMNPAVGVTAADVVNHSPENELERIFRAYGEEPQARRLARQIARRRMDRPFERTGDLAELISATLGGRRGKTHPATRVFQALRIEVNDELGVLERGLAEFTGLLAPGGRFAVITFHSLEDRIVKHYFREQARETIDHPAWPAPRRNPHQVFKAVTRKPITAGEDEIRRNPRARSAKLRVVEKL